MKKVIMFLINKVGIRKKLKNTKSQKRRKYSKHRKVRKNKKINYKRNKMKEKMIL